MKIKKIENKKIWEDFLLKCDEKTFLNSGSFKSIQIKSGLYLELSFSFENQR